jgi:hypothetical protein
LVNIGSTQRNPQLSGFIHRSLGKRAKSRSEE